MDAKLPSRPRGWFRTPSGLARREEREVLTAFGNAYTRYARITPAFFLRVAGRTRHDVGAKEA